MITPQIILSVNPGHTTAKVTDLKLQAACLKFGIVDPHSVAALLANCGVESGLEPIRENLYYTNLVRAQDIFSALRYAPNPIHYMRNPEALANLVYANKLGNGNEASGEGFLFRGGFYLQLTGRSNYARAAQLIGLPLLTDASLPGQIGASSLVSAAFWARMSNANEAALQGDIVGTRRAVNGPALLGLTEMLAIYKRVLPLLH